MSILPASSIGDESTGFYGTKINQSLRFEDGDSPYLLRTPSSSGNRKTWTISCWFKIGNIGLTANIISVFQSASPNQQVVIRFYQNKLYLYDFGGAYLISTNRVFRDTTNWYHMVWRFDSTQSTASERIKLYINGTQETDLNDNTYPSLNHDSLWNHTNKHLIGARTDNSTPTPIQEFDGYLAEFNLVDGQALGPESFGETKNGVWIPKSLSSISYGTNGFRLTFADSSSLGDDTSGNGNDFTSSGLAATDVVVDSPTNNFATALGSIAESDDYQGYDAPTSSEGNLKITASGSAWNNGGSSFGMTSGKWYAECIVNSWQASNYVRIGLRAKPARTYDEYFVLGNGTGQLDAAARNGRLPSFTTGDVIQFALDLENQAFYLGKNNTWGNSATATEIANGTTTNAFASGSEVPINDNHAYFFYAQPHTSTTTITWNFGQDSSFAGAKTAQGNSDGGDSNTDFYYTPPSGFLACNAINLPELTLSAAQDEQPTDHFNTVLYTGNGTGQTISGVGFQPDWTWNKNRDQSDFHIFQDSSRGAGKEMFSNSNTAEETYSTSITSFNTDGFVLGSREPINANNEAYVSWNWKINGGTTSTDSNGSLDSTIQVNTTAGISIALYNKPSQANHSFGHGLGSTPDSFWWKARNQTMNWIVYHKEKSTSTSSAVGFYLNSDLAGFATGGNWLTGLTDTTVSIADGKVSSGGNIDYICISFKEIAGFSKFGIYDGVSNANGTVVFTGFKPALVIFKALGADHWVMADNKRDPHNQVNGQLFPSSNAAESTSNAICDFLSNGFKMRRSAGSINQDGRDYAYWAWAEQPFKFSNAR